MEWKQLLCGDRIRPNYASPDGSGDLRSEYEKDYHRIIGSASFRRLQDKTQVFPLDRSDFVRTRLTHSMEVSSFCKSLGQNISQRILQERMDSGFLPEYQAYICDILQCAGLIHDIGNPPFGHFGETAIRDWFRKNLPRKTFQGEDGTVRPLTEALTRQMQEDFFQFEGNTQALRVVTRLHYLVDTHGMNLTKALLGTIIKYPASSLDVRQTSHIRQKKMGYFYADEETYHDVQESLGTGGNRHPLAFVLEAADDIAYLTADIEDAMKKGCISYGKLLEELQLYGMQVLIKSPKFHGDYSKLLESLKKKYQNAQRRGLQQADMNAIQNWSVFLQGWMIRDVANCFMEHYGEIMDGTYGENGEDLFTNTPGYHMMQALGDIANRYAFQSHTILKLEIAAQSIFDFLLDQLTDAAISYDTNQEMTAVQNKLMALVSDNYKAVYRLSAEGRSEEERLYLRLLLVTDSVCGMTDSYAKRLYQELNGIG